MLDINGQILGNVGREQKEWEIYSQEQKKPLDFAECLQDDSWARIMLVISSSKHGREIHLAGRKCTIYHMSVGLI